MNISTKAIHLGQTPDQTTGAITPPIYLTSTYKQTTPNKHFGYDYTRAGNPNFTNLEQTLASLENGKYATVFSSGLGAVTALISTLKNKDLVIGGNDMYGGTFRLFGQVFKKFGLSLITADTQNIKKLKNLLKKRPQMLIIESPTNPLLKISNIGAIAELTRRHGVLFVVDNTFATPYLQNPLDLGADVVVHSTTKYLNGHSDIIGGAVITNSKLLKSRMDFARKAIGLNPSPFDVWLISRGVKTLPIRMDKHCQNAFLVAKFLEKHPSVKKIIYPGLSSHPQYEIVKSQMRGLGGGMITVEFNLNIRQTKKLISSFQIFSLAESLGGVESLVDHPASMTHGSIPKKEREKIGIKDGLVRLSVGIEDPTDLINDLREQLLKV